MGRVLEWFYPANELDAIVRVAHRHRLPLDLILAGTGGDTKQIQDASFMLSGRAYERIYENIVKLAPNEQVGLEIGEQMNAPAYGLIGYALLTAPTLRESLQLFQRYHKQVGMPFDITLCNVGTETWIQADIVSAEGQSLNIVRLHSERLLASLQVLVEDMLQVPFRASRVIFGFNEPVERDTRIYQQFFNCPLQFGWGCHKFVIDNEMLDRPLPMCNPLTMRQVELRCQEHWRGHPKANNVVSELKEIFCNQDLRKLQFLHVTDMLGMSERTLRRRLREQGTSYQRVLDHHRRELAIHLLTTTDLDIQQISEQVGFHDATGFRRAFKKWTHYLPGKFRNRQTAAVL